MRRRRQDGLPRRHFRSAVRGDVVIHTAEGALRGRLLDLSLGGARIAPAADEPLGVGLAVGTPVRLDLHFADGDGWLAVRAVVVRADGPDAPFAAEFVAMPRRVRDAIEAEMLAALEADARPAVVIVDPRAARRQRLVRAVRRIGCRPIEAATPLEAIERVETAAVAPVGAVVGDELTQTGGPELAEWIARELPQGRVALVRPPTAPGDVVEAPAELADGTVTAVDDGPELTVRVGELLAGKRVP
jgi:CheY-like chemotaxis protein